MPSKVYTSEKHITNRIMKFLKDRGCYAVKQHGGRFGRAGVPDIICCYCGAFVAFEVKSSRPGATTSPAQNANIREIQAAGGYVNVVRSVDEVQRIFDSFDAGNDQ